MRKITILTASIACSLSSWTYAAGPAATIEDVA